MNRVVVPKDERAVICYRVVKTVEEFTRCAARTAAGGQCRRVGEHLRDVDGESVDLCGQHAGVPTREGAR